MSRGTNVTIVDSLWKVVVIVDILWKNCCDCGYFVESCCDCRYFVEKLLWLWIFHGMVSTTSLFFFSSKLTAVIKIPNFIFLL